MTLKVILVDVNMNMSEAWRGTFEENPKVPVEICADLMWTAYNLFQSREFPDFFSLRAALEEQLGDLGSMSSKTRPKRAATAPVAPQPGPVPPPVAPAPPTPSVKKADVD